MDRLDLLEEFYNMITYNMLCYSKNLLMTEAKEGYEERWENENEKSEIIEEMMKEEMDKNIELIISDKKEGGIRELSFCQEQILRMYPDTKFYIRNSNGGLLGGTTKLDDAIKYAKKCKKQYLNDPLNNKMEVFVLDKNGEEVYRTDDSQKINEDEECEEME